MFSTIFGSIICHKHHDFHCICNSFHWNYLRVTSVCVAEVFHVFKTLVNFQVWGLQDLQRAHLFYLECIGSRSITLTFVYCLLQVLTRSFACLLKPVPSIFPSIYSPNALISNKFRDIIWVTLLSSTYPCILLLSM